MPKARPCDSPFLGLHFVDDPIKKIKAYGTGCYFAGAGLKYEGHVNEGVVCEPFAPRNEWETPNQQPGSIQLMTPAPEWHRKLFNGLAQVLIQSTHQSGAIVLKASSANLVADEIKITLE